MKELIIKTQQELDTIPLDFNGYIYLEGGTKYNPLILRVSFARAIVIARGNCQLAMLENSTVQAMLGNSTVQNMRENSTVQRMLGNSTVQNMLGNSTVQNMWENSTVQNMRENSTVQNMRGNSTVQDMRENSTVQDMRGNSTVQDMRENSTVQDMRGNSTVKALYGEAMVSAYGTNAITCHGYNIVRTSAENEKNLTLVMSTTSHLIVIPDFKATFSDFKKRYPVVVHDKTAILYKAVHKRDGRYFSDYDSNFEYEIGKTYKHINAPKSKGACAEGLHIAIKDWAISYGKKWHDYALLECAVPIKNIVVAEDCDGKVRTSALTVLREVTEDE